ncbi:hypothetical protein NDU88_001922 [Pleurodeles waltl]|uniref:Uncharacterized protein n=1 Tax=Pleurodeles waltl TaxID=8319 RepID=A0AAV7S8Y8_PLEWA|nr:hypothetical protein NDU88_001922 [Pleurodeles waltl]
MQSQERREEDGTARLLTARQDGPVPHQALSLGASPQTSGGGSQSGSESRQPHCCRSLPEDRLGPHESSNP